MSTSSRTSLKDALLESVICTLSPDLDARNSGEVQLRTLEVTEEYGVYLAEYSLDEAVSQPVRQLCSVLLKQYVEVHWTQHSQKFCPPETSEKAKAIIRDILPRGLSDGLSKVRTSIAYAVSAIAHWDWPEQWPDLFNILMQALTSEFSRELCSDQIYQVVPILLPKLLKIFKQPDMYTLRTRSRVVDIYHSLVSHICELHYDIPDNIEPTTLLLYPSLGPFVMAFITTLKTPDGLECDTCLRGDIIKTLSTLVKYLSKKMMVLTIEIMPVVWLTFIHTSKIFNEQHINTPKDDVELDIDSDGETIGLENLIFATFEFMQVIVGKQSYRSAFMKSVKSLRDIIYYTIVYSQITEAQSFQWSLYPDKFVEDEDDDTFSYSVRISAQETLLTLCEQFPKCAVSALCDAVMTLLQVSETVKEKEQNWWKIHEAVMLSLGTVRPYLLKAISTGLIEYDIPSFLHTVVLADLNMNVSPFLLGRCLCLASKFTLSMTPELLLSFLQATVHGLSEEQHAPVRISAVRAIYSFANHMKLTGADRDALRPFLVDMVDGLVAIASGFNKEVLALCIETLNMLLLVDEPFTESRLDTILPLSIAVFLKHNADPFIMSLVQELFTVLARTMNCYDRVQAKLVPTLASILESPDDKMPDGMQAVSLECLQSLVRARKAGTPLTDLLLNRAFPAAVHATLTSSDNAMLQNGGECIRAFVSTDLDNITQWRDAQGVSGITYVVNIVSKLLDPKTSEFTATFVGRLVSILICQIGPSLGDNLDLMLRAILSKMVQSETLSVMQSLIMVFVNLIHHQMEAVLDFLSQVPGPSGQPALEFVLAELCSKQHLFYGAYESKVSAMALCKLLQFTIETNDTRLQMIEVQGELIIDEKSIGVKTRSKAAKEPDQWTRIPILVKMYKLIINELASQYCEEVEEEEYDEDNEDGQDNGDTSIFQDIDDELIDDEDEDVDPDDLSNPLYQINLKEYLTEFLISFSHSQFYSMFSQYQNKAEKEVLLKIGISC